MTLFLDVGGKDWEDLATDTSLLHMGHNCNHLPLDPRIKEALMAAMEAEEYRNYPPPYGFERLRTLIGEGLDLPEAEVLITHGSTDAIYQGLSVILRPGDEIITTDPGWPHIPNFAPGLGASVVEIPDLQPQHAVQAGSRVGRGTHQRADEAHRHNRSSQPAGLQLYGGGNQNPVRPCGEAWALRAS